MLVVALKVDGTRTNTVTRHGERLVETEELVHGTEYDTVQLVLGGGNDGHHLIGHTGFGYRVENLLP